MPEKKLVEVENSPDGSGIRFKVFEIIFGHHTPAGLAFDLTLLVAISVNVILVCLETVPEIKDSMQSDASVFNWFLIAEVFFTLLFAFEYGIRVWCVKNPWKYVFSFFGVVDVLAVVPSLIGLILVFTFEFGSGNQLDTATGSYTVIRSLRLLRVFRLIRIGKLENESSELASAVWRARVKVFVFVLVVLITVVIAGTLMYELEHRQTDSKFQSIPEGIYWAIVTMTTVGYGDIVPTTFLGKFISSLLILIGYSLIIVPTGFVSAEVIGSRGVQVRDERRCSNCELLGHEFDARYCKACGNALPEIKEIEQSAAIASNGSGASDTD